MPPSSKCVTFGPTSPARHQSPPERRERLREERRALVATIARRTGEEYRVINARVNRELKVASVAKCTLAQLERANALLEREARRR
jgi:hypothetical protein